MGISGDESDEYLKAVHANLIIVRKMCLSLLFPVSCHIATTSLMNCQQFYDSTTFRNADEEFRYWPRDFSMRNQSSDKGLVDLFHGSEVAYITVNLTSWITEHFIYPTSHKG